MIVEAMRQALEAMELEMKGYAAKHDRLMPAAHALRTAIAEAEKQEPVLKPCWYESKEKTMCRKCGQVHAEAIPPAAQWVGLTDEEIEREWQFLHDEEGNPPDEHDFARAIEAAHGIGEKK